MYTEATQTSSSLTKAPNALRHDRHQHGNIQEACLAKEHSVEAGLFAPRKYCEFPYDFAEPP